MAKLMRPAASFYDSSEDCLYFVDSEVGHLSTSQFRKSVTFLCYARYNRLLDLI